MKNIQAIDLQLQGNEFLIIGIVLLAIVLLTVMIMFFITRSKSPKEKQVDLDIILGLFQKDNVVSVSFIRNKIVMNFKDVNKVDVKLLHERGAKGVSIIGDKIKFYFDGGEQKNQEIYNQIKNFIER